jgi:hypothetical protein
MMDEYMGSQAYQKLAVSTRDLYQTGLIKFLNFVGHTEIGSNLTPRNASDFYRHLKRDYSEEMSMRYLCGPSGMCSYMLALRDLTFNPFAILSTNPDYDSRDVVWLPDERERFLVNAEALGLDYIGNYMDFLYVSAQRVYEQRLFRYEDALVDPESGERYFNVIQQKTRSKAPVWVSDRLFKNFGHDGKLPDMGYLFTKGGQPVSEQTIYKDFIKVKKASKIRPYVQMRDLRRARATDLMYSGKYTAPQVMALTGHKNEEVFRSVYVVTPKEATQWMLEET